MHRQPTDRRISESRMRLGNVGERGRNRIAATKFSSHSPAAAWPIWKDARGWRARLPSVDSLRLS